MCEGFSPTDTNLCFSPRQSTQDVPRKGAQGPTGAKRRDRLTNHERLQSDLTLDPFMIEQKIFRGPEQHEKQSRYVLL